MWRLGHRGACGYAPENTLASMRKAIELGCDGFEFDIQLSHDNIPVVIHDDSLERTTNGKGLVSNFTLEQLQKLNAGNGEKIPSLREVISMVNKRCRLFIELKAEKSVKPVVEEIANAVSNLGWDYEQFSVCSFNHLQIAEIHSYLPQLQTGALFVGIPVTLSQIAVEAGAWSLNSALYHTSRTLVDDAHSKGLKMLVWTANTPEEIATAKKLGVDGVFSNFPDRIV